ncbi:MAG: RNA polymerase sigma factor [Myxococcota bacterium]
MQDLDDHQLVLLVQATGEVSAYDELVRRHQAPLLGFLASVAGDDAIAEDATQRALFKAYRKIEQFAARSSFRTWLFSIGYREWAQIKRKRSPTPFASPPEPAVEMAFDRTMDLEAALACLPEAERTALLLCDAFEMSNAEAALAMDAPLGSVKTYIRRARQRMRAILLESDDE